MNKGLAVNRKPFCPTHRAGFTLVEIIVTVVVFGLLMAFTVPKFIGLVNKAQEGSTKHQLVRVRSAIAAYYGENQGVYPTDDLSCLTPKYIEQLPTANIPGLTPTDHVSAGSYEEAFNNRGGWAYVNDKNDPRFGDFFVNSDKEDSYGKPWNTH